MNTEEFMSTETVPTDETGPIGPSEAGRILAGYRHQRDGAETSTPEPVADPSSERSLLDPEPMVHAYPIPREEPGTEIEIKDAANELAKRRETSLVDVERNYVDIGGETHGRPKPAHLEVELSQAVHDLALTRDGEAQVQQAHDDLELQRAIDALRAGDAQQQAQQAEAPAEPVALDKQVTSPQANTGDDPVAKALQENPQLLSAVQSAIAQEQARADFASRQYAEAVTTNAYSAAASLVANFPELANLNPTQYGTALQVIASKDPGRAQAIHAHIGRVTALVNEAQRATQQQMAHYQQQAQQQWAQFSKASDDAYSDWADKQVSASERKAIEAEAREMMLEAYGNEQQLARAWQTNETIRSRQGQMLMFQAAQQRLNTKRTAEAQKSIRDKRDRTPPTVQHPGAGAVERPTAQSMAVMEASRQLDKTHSAKDAAKLLLAMRAARR